MISIQPSLIPRLDLQCEEKVYHAKSHGRAKGTEGAETGLFEDGGTVISNDIDAAKLDSQSAHGFVRLGNL
jgi:hypothetical protein